MNVRTITTGSFLTFNDELILADCSSGGISITLPSASALPGKELSFKKIDPTNNPMTIVGSIDNFTNPAFLDQYTGYTIVSDGSCWRALYPIRPDA